MQCRLITLDEVYECSYRLSQKILSSGFQPDLIVAIARGGFAPARFLCDFLHLADMTSIKVQHYQPGAQKEETAYVKFPLCIEIKDLNVLIVDDVNDTGDTLEVAIDHVKSFHPKEVKTAVLHEKTTTAFEADFKADIIREWKWLIYPWAAVEDVGNFIKQMDQPTKNVSDIKQWLQDKYGLKITEEKIGKILSLI